MVQGILEIDPVVQLQIGGKVIVLRPQAKGDAAGFNSLHRVAGVGVVPVVDDQTGSHGGKLVEGMLQILHGLKIIQMIVVDVEDYGDVR